MALSSPGVGSGLDVQTLVAKLVSAEIGPAQTRHDAQLKSTNAELSTLGQVKSSLASLQTSLANLSDISKMYTLKTTVSDDAYLSTTAKSTADKGTYQIEIQKLAQRHSVASTPFSSTVGGNLVINFGTYSGGIFSSNGDTPLSVTINPGATLNTIRDTINNAKSGVTASVVKDTNGSRLTLTSTKTGVDSAMQITGVPEFTYDPTSVDPLDTKLIQTAAAQNSEVNINGLVINQKTNILDDAIAGLTINLKKAEIGKTLTLTVDDNKDQVTTNINDFIKKYNDTTTLLKSLTSYNADTKTAGALQGDSQIKSLQSKLRELILTQSGNTTSSIQRLTDLGITTGATGLLVMNQTKYDAALSAHYEDIGALFAKTGAATNPNVSSTSVSTKVNAGTYAINLTEFTPGVSMAGTIGGLPATSSDGVTLKGTGDLSGLSVNILSGSAGSQGTVTVTDGLANQLNTILDSYIGTDGSFDKKTTLLNATVKDLGKTQTNIDARSSAVERRYLNQFTALDGLLNQMQNTSSFLTQQLANLPKFN
jgi:flagellar hook-associated protein 2